MGTSVARVVDDEWKHRMVLGIRIFKLDREGCMGLNGTLTLRMTLVDLPSRASKRGIELKSRNW